jgi:hypothetical protein
MNVVYSFKKEQLMATSKTVRIDDELYDKLIVFLMHESVARGERLTITAGVCEAVEQYIGEATKE